MNSVLTHRQRIENCLAGAQLDRLPIALWRHFPVADQDPSLLAKMAIEYQAIYDFDLIKLSPASSYCLLDYGIQDEWRGHPEGTREYTRRVIQHPEDWERLPLLDPSAGFLGQSLQAIRQVQSGNLSRAPILQTVFNPLSQAKNLAGQERLLHHMRAYPDALKRGLETLTLNTQAYLAELQRLKLDGIFYAVQHAQYQLLSEEEFFIFSKQYDLRVLEEAQSIQLRMAHLHGEHVMFDQVASYPVNIINWHDREGEVNLKAGLERFAGVACGGISRLESMLLGSPQLVQTEVLDAALQTGGNRLIIGTGCVMMTTSPLVNIQAACEAAVNYRF
jgi:uroporphyrinogen decarboxylase